MKVFDLTLPGEIVLTLRSTAKGYAVVQVYFVRHKTDKDPEHLSEIDRKLAEGKNHIIKLGESTTIPGVFIKLRIGVSEEPSEAKSPDGYYPPGSDKPKEEKDGGKNGHGNLDKGRNLDKCP